MMYQSKISRMRKKSSDEQWLFRALLVSVFGLFIILTFCLRVVTLPASYGIVPVEIPVVQASFQDPGFHQFREGTTESLSSNTPAVVLTTDAFFFGDLSAFSENFSDMTNKFVIRHASGSPQLSLLLQQLTKWSTNRSHEANIPLSKILVLIPAGEIPVPILTEVIAGLRSSPHFKRVVLSSGLN